MPNKEDFRVIRGRINRLYEALKKTVDSYITDKANWTDEHGVDEIVIFGALLNMLDESLFQAHKTCPEIFNIALLALQRNYESEYWVLKRIKGIENDTQS